MSRSASRSTRGRRIRRRSRLVPALIVLLAGLVAWSAAIGIWRDGAVPDGLATRLPGTRLAATDVRLDSPVAVATRFVDAFLAVEHSDMASLADRVLALSTDPFQSQYRATREQLASQAEERQTIVRAEVRSVAIAELSDDDAVVLVAADGHRRDAPGSGEMTTPARMRLTLVRTEDGWAVADVRFVR